MLDVNASETARPGPDKAGFLRVWQVVAVFLVVGAAIPIALHTTRFGVHAGQIALVVFTWFNVMVTLWEMSLAPSARLVERQHARFVTEYCGRERDRVIDFFTAPIRLRDIPKPSSWAEVWSSYSLFDSAYANRQSFGFWVDSANGYLTVLPSILVIYGFTFDIVPARTLGIVGLIIFWTMFYGTIVYFCCYLFNKEYVGHTKLNLALFIGVLNSPWLIGPIWGMVTCVRMIDSNSFAVVR